MKLTSILPELGEDIMLTTKALYCLDSTDITPDHRYFCLRYSKTMML